MTSSKLNILPKALSPGIIILVIRVSVYELGDGGRRHKHSVDNTLSMMLQEHRPDLVLFPQYHTLPTFTTHKGVALYSLLKGIREGGLGGSVG